MKNTPAQLACVFLVLLLPLPLSAQEYYERKIEISTVREPTVISVPIHTLGTPGKQYGVQKEDGTPVPFQREDTQKNLLFGAEILEAPDAAAHGPQNRSTNIVDGNAETIFSPAATTEHRFLFRTTIEIEPEHLFFQLHSGTVKRIRVRQGNGENQLSLSYSGVPSGTRVPLMSVRASMFEVLLETQDMLDIAELQLLQTESVLLFQALPQERYYLIPNGSPSAEVSAYSTDNAIPADVGPAEYAATGTDADGDGVPDNADNCAQNANEDQKDTDGDGMGDICDIAPLLPNTRQEDSDGDGVPDTEDNCPQHANSEQKDIDGDGVGWECDDADSDGIPNASDNCVGVQNTGQEDEDEDGLGDACNTDQDRDGIPKETDNCPLRENKNQEDPDGDSIGSACDLCPLHYDPSQEDEDANGIGDSCQQIAGSGIQDFDRDSVPDTTDNCIHIANADQRDTDKDTVGDVCDSCPEHANRAQRDRNGDGKGDACTDTDGDGIEDDRDNCPANHNVNQLDADGDGRGDPCDDEDKDRVPNVLDNCPNTPNLVQEDGDNDGIGDACDDYDDRKKRPLPWLPFAVGAGVAAIITASLKRT